ncbi:MAG: nitronate monooxygenase [Rickettsiales bacterium]|nr:nitronate monooxygenase [Pseudomonadota bacterium]MDA0966210.1 nitronate monooxygenase [Pseudomonadota bacterium]MDG4543125.1 nitronate monooxygenase [Rickettsiales bacterium]MDG4545323.1 nitronate monooxygenase [Rickettsiales bacterium]MDG4547772.1 nitronate monooxygenase [Rickettsiales bacterium]
MLKNLKPVLISGKEVLPIVEGGKGVAVTNGDSSGAFAAAGAVGTFSGVNADSYDKDGNVIPVVYKGHTRRERHEELVQMGIQGGIHQAKIAHETSNGEGRLHINVLWEMGGAQRVLEGVLEGAKGLVHGVTCGAGMPYKLAEIAEKYNVYYYPIVSSMRAFRALWKRSYSKSYERLGAVVYEDPWLAGGHNGLSNSEDPKNPEDPYPRVAQIRSFMNSVGLNDTPIVMAGGVWYLKDWSHWLDNPEIGPICFQYGTRPILTKESPVPDDWKKRLLTLSEGDVLLNRFSPTGFYSSAVRNDFLRSLEGRQDRQIPYVTNPEGVLTEALPIGPRKRNVYVETQDKERAVKWISEGYVEALKTPESTLIFVTKKEADIIHEDQVNCMGCLSHCSFSNWKDHDDYTTGKKADPRSFCIQKTLQDIAHGAGSIEDQLMFAGHNAYKFAQDPFYKDGFVPTVKELVDRIMTGE